MHRLHQVDVLVARGEPHRRRAAEQRDELAPFHSITSSARASSVAGTSMPIVFAVCKLMTSSNLLACIIGKSAGFSPLSSTLGSRYGNSRWPAVVAPAPRAATPRRRRRASLRTFVVGCSLPCDPSGWGSFMQWRDDTTLPSRGL